MSINHVHREEFRELSHEIKLIKDDISKSLNGVIYQINQAETYNREQQQHCKTTLEYLSRKVEENTNDLKDLVKAKVESQAQLTLIKNAFKISANIKGFLKFCAYIVVFATASEGFSDFLHFLHNLIKRITGA